MNIGLLTCERLKELTLADQKIQAMLISHGLTVDALVWDDEKIDWTKYDLLIFRNTWDYYEKEVAFMEWLDRIEKLKIPTQNTLKTVKNNVHKYYLRDFEKMGIDILPTIFIDKNASFNLAFLIPNSWDKAVIKPAFSAGSYLTDIASKDNLDEQTMKYNEIGKNKDLLLQKFMPEIQSLGETSLLFFNKKFSHAVCKTPKAGDFRIQSQFGGMYQPTTVSDNVLAQAQKIVDTIDDELLYARVDGIVIGDKLYLMELELIEPDLYLDHHADAYESFVNAILSKA